MGKAKANRQEGALERRERDLVKYNKLFTNEKDEKQKQFYKDKMLLAKYEGEVLKIRLRK